MKKILTILTLAVVLVSMFAAISLVAATDVGTGVGITVNTQQFAPKVWMCDNRSVRDDNTENSLNGLNLSERKNNYAFEGESIHWTVLVMDKNKIEDVQDVVGTVGPSQGAGNDVEVECERIVGDPFGDSNVPASCNAQIGQEKIVGEGAFNSQVMAFYDCRLTVETADSMHGEYFLTVEAKDAEGLSGTMAENEFWFLNPTIALAIDGNIAFDDVMPGTDSYSQTVLVGNDAEAGSGVMLDMFISGTDFYDPSSSGAMCPGTNQLALTNFRYFVTNGAFVSKSPTTFDTDAEGYTSIPYSTDISGAKRIMRWNNAPRGASPSSSVVEQDWNNGNALTPGAEMALTFKLSMPEPCNGDFSAGQIFFWGEAI